LKLISTLALQAFEELTLEKQRHLLLTYVKYVEGMIEGGDEPLFFLEWFLTADTSDQTEEQHDVSKEFPITSITKEDLISAGFPVAIVEKLTDGDMQEIASAMEDIYCDHGFWEAVELCTKRILKHKEEETLLENNEHTTGEEDGFSRME
jgi:hypothetical protein